jgi:hypothetical protein
MTVCCPGWIVSSCASIWVFFTRLYQDARSTKHKILQTINLARYMFWFLYHFSDAQFLKLSINIRHKPQRKRPRWHESFGPLSMSLMCLKWSDTTKPWVYEKYLLADISHRDQSSRPCKCAFFSILYEESIFMFGYQTPPPPPHVIFFFFTFPSITTH